MKYAAIKNCDIANGPGVRVSLFVSGCTHHCKGRFQPETWDFDYGRVFTESTENRLFSMLEPDYIAGLTILGGEPMEYQNMIELFPFVFAVKQKYPKKTVWLYSGWTYEELMARKGGYNEWQTKTLLKFVDILVDGPFIEAKKNIALRFRGSENQRIIDLRQTEKQGKIVLWNEGEKKNDVV